MEGGEKQNKIKHLIGSINVKISVLNRKSQNCIESVGLSPLMAPGHLSVQYASEWVGNEGDKSVCMMQNRIRLYCTG